MSKAKVEPKTEVLEQFKAKKIGANMIATMGTEKYSRKVSKEEGDAIIKKITLYNKKPNETAKKAIIKMLTPESVKIKEEKEKNQAKVKGLKQQIKKESKKGVGVDKKVKKENKDLLGQLEDMLTDNPDAVDKLQALLNKFKKHEEKAPKERYTTNPRRGEVYRNGVRVYIYTAEDGKEVDKDGYLLEPVAA